MIVALSQLSKVSRSQAFIATEATRPSGASTVKTDRTPSEVWLFFAAKMGLIGPISPIGIRDGQERHGPVAQLVRAHA